MIDVVFLLIVFFMVGTKFYELEREFDVEVPEVSQANPLTSAPEELVVLIRRDGELFLGDEPATLDELTSARQQATEQGLGPEIFEEIDQRQIQTLEGMLS